MDKQNITFSISNTLLRKVKLLAVKRNTTLNSLLIHTLEELVVRDERYQKAQARNLRLLEKGLDLGTHGEINSLRKDLHKE